MAVDPGARERVRLVAAELASRPPEDRSTRSELLVRAVAAIDRISQDLDEDALQAVSDLGTDRAFLEALSRLAAPLSALLVDPDPLAAAKARGERAKRDILAAQGELLDAHAVALRLGIDVAEVDRRCAAGMLLALPTESGDDGFPSWQFADGGLLPGLDEVLRNLTATGPWSRVLFLLGRDPFLDGQSPLDYLHRGEIGPVKRLAAAYDHLVAG